MSHLNINISSARLRVINTRSNHRWLITNEPRMKVCYSPRKPLIKIPSILVAKTNENEEHDVIVVKRFPNEATCIRSITIKPYIKHCICHNFSSSFFSGRIIAYFMHNCMATLFTSFIFPRKSLYPIARCYHRAWI